MRHAQCNRGGKVGDYDRSQCLVCWTDLNPDKTPQAVSRPPMPVGPRRQLTPEELAELQSRPRRCCGGNAEPVPLE